MKSMYLLLNIASLSIPFVYSFNKKMRFIKNWKSVFSAIAIVAVFFIIWDVIFTKNGVWGFNNQYHLSYEIGGLPFEELLFFICIPYASVFIHYSLAYFKPEALLSEGLTKGITILLFIVTAIVLFSNLEKAYTGVNFSLLLVTLLLGLLYGLQSLRRFYLSFLIILIPFFIVNGILTGSFIEAPVVWYNDNENLGIRLFTIPVEDIGYAFNMLFLAVLLIEKIKKIDKSKFNH